MSDYWLYGLLIVGMILLAYRQMKKRRKLYRRLPDRDFPEQWTVILNKRVPFYQRLSASAKKDFEYKCHIFLLNHNITAQETVLTDLDRILIAAGAVIPIFRLEKWHYTMLKEVTVYPDKFLIPDTDQMARGLVGWGAMAGQVWFSRKAIYEGFHIDNDQKNVVIHEFIHIMDMQDGFADGVLDELMGDDDIEAWLELVRQKSELIGTDRSSIRGYAKENPVEFLAASGEFYFESPDKMRSEHPVLYQALERIFNPNSNWF
jgi:Mlc titration factor MtfA (ptsG expression regulator)